MKKFYEEPELELIKFAGVDIITTSGSTIEDGSDDQSEDDWDTWG